jgi:hypothetical protein
MKDYTEASVVLTEDAAFTGLAEIRGFFDALVANTPPAAWDVFSVDHLSAAGSTAFLVWSAGEFVSHAVDTFVVEDGKIMAQTFSAR